MKGNSESEVRISGHRPAWPTGPSRVLNGRGIDPAPPPSSVPKRRRCGLVSRPSKPCNGRGTDPVPPPSEIPEPRQGDECPPGPSRRSRCFNGFRCFISLLYSLYIPGLVGPHRALEFGIERGLRRFRRNSSRSPYLERRRHRPGAHPLPHRLESALGEARRTTSALIWLVSSRDEGRTLATRALVTRGS